MTKYGKVCDYYCIIKIYLRYGFVDLNENNIKSIINMQEVHRMLKKKYYLYLYETEYSVLIKSLVHMKNKLTQQGRYTDCVDDLLVKVIAAPVKRI